MTVTSSGLAGGAAATVRLAGPAGFQEQTATTSFETALTFIELPPGTYTLTATAFGFDCPQVSATVQADQTTMVTVTCTRLSGTVMGTVTSGGMPIEGASVRLTAPGLVHTRTTGVNGGFTLGVPAGEYVVTAVHFHHDCASQTVIVQPEQTTTANLSCTPKTTGLIVGTVIVGSDPGFRLGDVAISLSGPVTREGISSQFGTFTFEDLPPGPYTMTASPFGLNCLSVNVDVQAAQTTTVQISCTFRRPIGSEIAGNWVYGRLVRSQTGSCPAPLPDQGTGSMTFDPGNETIQIVGLDPALAITGAYDEESGDYTGTGSVVMGDGSTIQSTITVTFDLGFDFLVVFFTDLTPSHVWTRQHRDPGGNVICTEVYGATGGR